MDAKERLILALDVPDLKSAVSLLDKLESIVGLVKVNSLAVAEPSIVSIIQERNMGVWRDFKHHDIPGTVANYIKADIKDGLMMTSIHTLGGIKMMEYAVKEAKKTDLKIVGITILTSHSQDSFTQELGISGSIQDKVKQLALSAQGAGLQAVVASPKEAKILRDILLSRTLILTPGIKPKWAVKREDQARVTTPYQAIMDGSDNIVVGSAIHRSKNPYEAAEKIITEIDQALSDRNL